MTSFLGTLSFVKKTPAAPEASGEELPISRHSHAVARQCSELVASGIRAASEAGRRMAKIERNIERAAALLKKTRGSRRDAAAQGLRNIMEQLAPVLSLGVSSTGELLELAREASRLDEAPARRRLNPLSSPRLSPPARPDR